MRWKDKEREKWRRKKSPKRTRERTDGEKGAKDASKWLFRIDRKALFMRVWQYAFSGVGSTPSLG